MIERIPPWNESKDPDLEKIKERFKYINEAGLKVGAKVLFRHSKTYAPQEDNRWRIININEAEGKDKGKVSIVFIKKFNPDSKEERKDLGLEVEPQELKLFISAWMPDK